MRFAYYPGCVAETSDAEADYSTRRVAKKLDIELKDLPSATCCGAGDVAMADPDFNIALNARTLALAEKENLDIVTICNLCLLTIKSVNKQLKENPEVLSEVNKILSQINLEYNGGVQVKHFLWVLVQDFGLENLKNYVVSSLDGLKVAPFYGCQILRPSKEVQFEDPYDPHSLENLICTLGAEPVDYEGRIMCCGFPTFLVNKNTALKMLGERLLEAKEKGADCIVTPCPLCHLALDTWQPMAEKLLKRKIDLPIFFLSQLIGLAMGINKSDLKLDRHFISPESLLEKINFKKFNWVAR